MQNLHIDLFDLDMLVEAEHVEKLRRLLNVLEADATAGEYINDRLFQSLTQDEA